jgi:hypothetical protein
MTSSFQNVVGTPRDAVPDISNTNYLKTSADMTEAVNEDSNERIKDTKQFFNQLIELEELAASKFDKRLDAISSLAGSIGSIRKKRLAKEADGLTKEFLKEQRLQFQEQITKVIDGTEDDNAFQEGLALGEINRDTTLSLAEKLDLQLGIIPNETLEGKLSEHMSYYVSQGRPLVINDVLNNYNASSATSQGEFSTFRQRTLNGVYRTVIYNWLASGGDPSDPRLERRLFEKVLPIYNKELDSAQRKFVYDLEKTQKDERTRVLDDRITKAVKTSKANFYSEGGLVDAIKEEKNFDGPQAQNYVYERVGSLVQKNVLTPEEGERIMDAIPFTPTNEPNKTYNSVDEYLDTIKNKDSVFYAKASGRVETLRKIIHDKKKERDQIELDTSDIQAKAFEREEIDPLVAASADGTLEMSQIRSLYEEFVEAPWYIEGHTKIPKKLEAFHNKTHTGGSRDKQVVIAQEFSSEINQALEDVDLFYREQKTLDAKEDLGLTDTNAVRRLQAEFKRQLYGENGKDLEALKFAIGSGKYTFQQRVDEILKNMEGRLESIIKAPAVVPLSEAVGDLLELRAQVRENPDLLFSKTALKGEDVNSLFDFLNTGGVRNPELQQFYKNARFRVIEDGKVRVLGGYEAAEVRGKELGIYDQKGKKLMNFNAKILKDAKAVNDVENKTTAQKITNAFSGGKGEKMTEFLTQHAINRSGGTSMIEDNAYTYKGRSGRTSPRGGVTRMNGARIVALAEDGSTGFGRYLLSSENILELHKNGMIDLNKKFTEDQQSLAVINLMALNSNRTNSISGAVTEETKNFRKLTNFSSEELDVIKQIFPNLSENYFAQFQTLEAEVAQLILSDLEKFQKQIAAERQKKKDERAAEKLRRSKLSKRELRGR